MRRLFRMSFLLALLGFLSVSVGYADKPDQRVSGRIAPGDVRIFAKDTTYTVWNKLVVGGTLIIEPGTEVKFEPNGRIIDSTGGRIIADGNANAVYNANPDGIDPMPGKNNQSWVGYSDLGYFLYNGSTPTINVGTTREKTVNPVKYNYVFNVLLNKTTRKIVDFPVNGNVRNNNPSDPNLVVVPFEKAIVYNLSGIETITDPVNDSRNTVSWARTHNVNINITAAPIVFKGQVADDITREKGHFIILPGARAAFFRNCKFENMRKDITVDDANIYEAPDFPTYSKTDLAKLNKTMRDLNNGAGGAITTYSSRTWLLNCDFSHNMARNKAGALQVLQSPEGYPTVDISGLPNYSATKNPALTEIDGTPSAINANLKRIDNMDESFDEPNFTDYERQSFDDGRVAMFLGRMRNLTFSFNHVTLSNVKSVKVGNVWFEMDDLDNPADYPQPYGNYAKGGAVYIAGRTSIDNSNQIEVGLGVNDRISINNGNDMLVFDDKDTVEFSGNYAYNYQKSINSEGAMGGAIYLGRNTSLIACGKYNTNVAKTVFMDENAVGPKIGDYAKGGAIYCENTLGRLQLRGGPGRGLFGNNTRFYKNEAGNGGAVYVEGNQDNSMSPVIGGSDVTANTRDYGFYVKFEENKATGNGGAIYTKRNMRINGSGGVEAHSYIGYSNDDRVSFTNNEAAYSGGAITIALPYMNPPMAAEKRAVFMARALFQGNKVGFSVANTQNKSQICGGGAVYSADADLNVIKAVEFTGNEVKNGNGGALAMAQPLSFSDKFFITDLDVLADANGNAISAATPNPVPASVTSYNGPFVWDMSVDKYAADARMMTRFLDNKISWDDDVLAAQNGTGMTQVNAGTIGTTVNINAVKFVDNNNGVAVGANGTIIKLSSAGAVWEYKTVNGISGKNLKDVTFTTSKIGYIVGDQGLALKTIDGGNNWSIIRQPVSSYNLSAITFANSSNGYAVGTKGNIVHITDVNNTVTFTELVSGTANDLNSVKFTGVTTGYAVGANGTILNTTNGNDWNVQNANTSANFKDVYFTDAATGYIVGDQGVVAKTVNGGNAWGISIPIDNNTVYNSILFNANTGYIVGNAGVALKTTDGITWTKYTINMNGKAVQGKLNDISMSTATTGVVSGDYGTLLRTTDAGLSWSSVLPQDLAFVNVKRYHPGLNLPENGIGLGGAIYILDSISARNNNRNDYVRFNRVRIQDNTSYTGSAIYSDNYDLKLVFTRSLATGNKSLSEIGKTQNAIFGPAFSTDTAKISGNFASSDLAGATFYGEIVGPLPYEASSVAANSFYGNDARFLIRLPDAPNTKGILAGRNPGLSGIDSLVGNYWGTTGADVTVFIEHTKDQDYPGVEYSTQETFYVASDPNKTWLSYKYNAGTDDLLEQGPFEVSGTSSEYASNDETIRNFTYNPIPLRNGVDENTVGDKSIPDYLLMSGSIYDLYDKGTDIKVADYSKRRLSPIEDFAVGIPPYIVSHNNANHPNGVTYLTRWLRDPSVAEAKDESNNLKYPIIAALQGEFQPDQKGNYYHPIGYPLFLETKVDYSSFVDASNHDPRLLNESVFFVINETTGDFIRTNFKQVEEDGANWQTFRARVDLIPDLTKRNPKGSTRRISEKLIDLGIGDMLMNSLYRNGANEDNAAVGGRKYIGHKTQMGGAYVPGQTAGIDNLYLNRDNFAPTNQDMATYWGGEKYQALPVDTGDVVRIVSRTALWKNGVQQAYNEGLSFKVVGSSLPPVFTGNIVNLQQDTIYQVINDEANPGQTKTIKVTDFINKIFVTEDRAYPQAVGTYSRLDYGAGRDSILAVTAIDLNGNYDPRAMDPKLGDKYSYLAYGYNLASNSALSKWLSIKAISANQTDNNPKDGAKGYILFKGRPINPYVVPGGEDVSVWASNWAPGLQTIEALKALNWSDDLISKFIYLFAPSMHAPKYDLGENNTRARFLQQDTINNSWNNITRYNFKLFVVDSLPRFIAPDAKEEVVYKEDGDVNSGVYVKYEPSVYTCGQNSKGYLKANLTDKLRFQADFNTDDEAEDAVAASQNWDFRYGKTSYGFMSVSVRPGDTTVVDTVTGVDGLRVLQLRPTWMANKYLYQYASESTLDNYGVDFQTSGKLNVRIPAEEAETLLTPFNSSNMSMNLDTMFTVVVNDGHGGMVYKPIRVYVNVAPKIISTTLPDAKEGVDYNPSLLDSNKMIKIYDPNFDQTHRFELIYENDKRTSIPKDPCFAEAGNWDLAAYKTTPSWLQIDSVSGLLYGMPSVKDAPSTVKVSVLVWDRDEEAEDEANRNLLPTIKTFDLKIDSVNHSPSVTGIPSVACVDKGSAFKDSIWVSDPDFYRKDSKEVITIKIIKPTTGVDNWTITPSTINAGNCEPGTDSAKVLIKTDKFNLENTADGKIDLQLQITDSQGNIKILDYILRYSDKADFISHITVANSKGAYQNLEWGTALNTTDAPVTTGDESLLPSAKHLDRNYCEYELPPLPYTDIFDARWFIPTTKGTLRNIHPRANGGILGQDVFRAVFKSGGEDGTVSSHYPIYISWYKSEIPAKDDNVKNPNGSTWYIMDPLSNGGYFSYNMKTGKGTSSSDIYITDDGDQVKIIINKELPGFNIRYDYASDVTTDETLETSINNVTPNPVDNNSNINFSLRSTSNVKIDVVDELGNVVNVLTNDLYNAGTYSVNWNASDFTGKLLANGSYTVRMIAGTATSTYQVRIIR